MRKSLSISASESRKKRLFDVLDAVFFFRTFSFFVRKVRKASTDRVLALSALQPAERSLSLVTTVMFSGVLEAWTISKIYASALSSLVV